MPLSPCMTMPISPSTRQKCHRPRPCPFDTRLLLREGTTTLPSCMHLIALKLPAGQWIRLPAALANPPARIFPPYRTPKSCRTFITFSHFRREREPSFLLVTGSRLHTENSMAHRLHFSPSMHACTHARRQPEMHLVHH